jgi:hypothetical protein
MAVLKWIAICDKAIVEAETRVLSLIGMVERINVAAPPPPPSPKGKRPLIPYRFSVVQFWTRSDAAKGEKVRARLTLLAPDRKQFGRIEQLIDLTQHKNVRSIGQAPGIPAVGPGQYFVLVHVSKDGRKWRLAGRESFEVNFAAGSEKAANAKKTH